MEGLCRDGLAVQRRAVNCAKASSPKPTRARLRHHEGAVVFRIPKARLALRVLCDRRLRRDELGLRGSVLRVRCVDELLFLSGERGVGCLLLRLDARALRLARFLCRGAVRRARFGFGDAPLLACLRRLRALRGARFRRRGAGLRARLLLRCALRRPGCATNDVRGSDSK